ncbi:DUF3106 domain-containing protein [Roseateles asaccharophilus]|uniref:DUF3106 domain-containing protein n=1 Tax=Roseateles asaccharophilus TaxID=582607 RepID=A0ABU2A2L1_9BURK|nr:DUF3106 domain-containing protein [Roseateles asaccharophilus]MDR7331427.1 hypothetical protein [Roseateles asaccharophilus]
MRKNDRMCMTRAAITLPAFFHLTLALLLSAAELCAFAQTTDEAPPPDSAASAVPPAAPSPRIEVRARPLTKPITPSALSVPPANWSELSSKQQALLAPLERDWPEISDTQRSKWLSATPTLATMSGEEIKRVHDRIRDWTMLSGSERLNARISFQVSRQLTPEQRQARWEAYQALPAEERRALAEKAIARRQALAEAPARAAKPQVAQRKSDAPATAPTLVTPALVTSILVQAKPGATTVLITRDLAKPLHLKTEQLRLVDPRLVDPRTLLPLKKTPAASAPRP